MALSIHEILLHVDSDADDADRDLGQLGAELLALDRTEAEASLELDTRDFHRDLAVAFAEMEAIDGSTAEVELDVDTSAVDRARRAADDLGGAGGGGGGLLDLLSNFGGRILLLIRLLPILIPMVVSLGAAIVAMAGSLGLAVAGLGALALAAGAASAPLIALAVGAVQRFTDAKEAADELKAATEAVQGAEQAEADAQRNLTDSQRAAAWAQDDLVAAREEARRQAQQTITAALNELGDAEDGLATAQRNELAAQQALTDAREAATQALVDQRLAAEGAALSEERAALNLERARNALRALEDEGVTGIRLRDARLAVEEAELALKTAREQGKRTQDDLNAAEKAGIEGSDQVVAAKQQLADASAAVIEANQDVAAAQREVTRAQREARGQDEGVIAARRAMLQANRAVTDSERALARATDDLSDAQKERNKLLREAAPLAAGTAGRAMLKAARDANRVFQGAIARGADEVFGGIATFLERITPLLERLTGEFTVLGRAVGDSFARWGAELSDPVWTSFFERMTEAGARIVPKLTDAAIHLARVFRDIADAALPFLEEAIDGFDRWARGLSQTTGDAEATSSAVGTLMGHLRSWAELTRQLGLAAFNIFRGGAPAGQDLADDLAGSLERWNEWASSDEGQARIRRFFDRVVPLARELFGLIGQLAEAGIRWGELTAPALEPLVDILGRILDFVNKILGALAELPGPLGDVASAIALFAGGRAIFGRGRRGGGIGGGIFDLLLGGALLRGLKGIGTTIFNVGRSIGTRLLPLIARIGPAFLRVLGPIGLAAGAILEFGDDVGKGLAEAVGYTDEYIAQQEAFADAQGRLAESLYQQVQVQRELGKQLKGGFVQEGELFDVFTPKQIRRMKEVAARGGKITSLAFVQAGLEEIRRGRAVLQRAWSRTVGGLEAIADRTVNSIKRRFGTLPSAIATILRGVVSVIRGLAGNFNNAGAALGDALGRGAVGAGQALVDALRGVGKKARDQLPGSEPRDPRSPLRRLDRAGAAVVENFARGMRGAARRAVGSINAELGAGVAGALRGVKVGGGGGGGPVSNSQRNTFNLTVPGGGSPDPVATVSAISRGLRRRGLSLA